MAKFLPKCVQALACDGLLSAACQERGEGAGIHQFGPDVTQLGAQIAAACRLYNLDVRGGIQAFLVLLWPCAWDSRA